MANPPPDHADSWAASDASESARILTEFRRREKEIPTDTYGWSHPGNLLLHQQAARGLIRLLNRAAMFPLRGKSIADIGCGDGAWLLEFAQWGASTEQLAGIDLNSERMHRARRRLPAADLRAGNAAELPWPDASFDMASQFTVFTSILDPAMKRAIAQEMLRIVKPGGAILWFDFRFHNPRNKNVRGIGADEVRSLFPGCEVHLSPVVLAPPLARVITRWSWPLAEILSAAPLLRTHYAGLIQKL